MDTRCFIGAKTKKMQKRVKAYEGRINREIEEKEGLLKSEDSRQPQCPKEKEKAIMEALKAFQMI